MAAEQSSRQGRKSEIVPFSSLADFPMLEWQASGELKKGEFQSRPGTAEGQKFITFRDRTAPKVGSLLRPGRFTVVELQNSQNEGTLMQNRWALNHPHALHRAQHLAQTRPRPDEVVMHITGGKGAGNNGADSVRDLAASGYPGARAIRGAFDSDGRRLKGKAFRGRETVVIKKQS